MLLILAGYIYACLAVCAIKNPSELLYGSIPEEIPTWMIWVKGVGLLFLPLIFLLAALVLSAFKSAPFQMLALGMAVVAGACYCWLLPNETWVYARFANALLLNYRYFPSIFPFNLIFANHQINLLAIKSPVWWLRPWHQTLYLLGILLLMAAAVLMLIQSRRQRRGSAL